MRGLDTHHHVHDRFPLVISYCFTSVHVNPPYHHSVIHLHFRPDYYAVTHAFDSTWFPLPRSSPVASWFGRGESLPEFLCIDSIISLLPATPHIALFPLRPGCWWIFYLTSTCSFQLLGYSFHDQLMLPKSFTFSPPRFFLPSYLFHLRFVIDTIQLSHLYSWYSLSSICFSFYLLLCSLWLWTNQTVQFFWSFPKLLYLLGCFQHPIFFGSPFVFITLSDFFPFSCYNHNNWYKRTLSI